MISPTPRQNGLGRSEEPRSKLRGTFQGKSLNGGCHPKTSLAPHPCKQEGILAFSHKYHLKIQPPPPVHLKKQK